MRAIDVIKAAIKSHQVWIDYFDKHPEREYSEKCKSVGDRDFHKERIADYIEAITTIEQLQDKNKKLRGYIEAVNDMAGLKRKGSK